MKKQKCKGGVWLQANPDISTYIYFSPPCKMKTCVSCARMMMWKHVYRIATAHHEHPELHWYFITLTQDSEYHQEPIPDDGNKSVLQHHWTVFRKRMRRDFDTVMYVRVYERHKTGVFHLHMIVALSEPLEIYREPVKGNRWRNACNWLADELKGVGLGYIYDVQALKSKNIRYVAKYATKSNLTGIRAIDYSQNFPKQDYQKDDNGLEWHYLGNIEIDHWVKSLMQSGATVIVLNETESDNEDG